jgi:ABC-type antimicrobial peptide transport system permease subunit
MPDFPGLAGEENCRDWDPGIPVDFDKIRNKDEDYWDLHRGIPKAFVPLKTAQALWQNRFGNLTAIRFHNNSILQIEQNLKKELDPAAFGLVFRPVRKDGIRASTESVDFAELFLGLSFFIIIAAMILTGLLFVLSLEQRTKETGLYLALGFNHQLIRRIVFFESGLLAIIGVVLGGILGVFYNQIVLLGLTTIWQGAVGTTALSIHVELSSVMIGLISGLLIALITLILVIRKHTQKSVSILQAGSVTADQKLGKRRTRLSLVIGIGGFLIAILLIIFTGQGRGKEATIAFFGAGTLLLISSIALTSFYLDRMQKITAKKPGLINLGIRNMSRSKLRSLLLVGLLASGLFIVFTVGANRHGAIQNPYERSSGTGGFAFYAQTLMPVLYDLNSDKGRDFYRLDDIDSEKVSFIPFRVKEGEDASCLNLNRVSTPQLIGLKPELLDKKRAFGFSTISEEVDKENPWLALNGDPGDDIIPGIADETVIIWGLGKSVGDTLDYMDERGNNFRIRLIAGLANSVFQGNIIISEDVLIERYPSVSGHRLFLVDCIPDVADSVSNTLSWAMQDLGIDITSTGDRLAGFNEVENTYLSIFLILGGFGLILGTIGLGIVVMRNILERRGELALLKAVGFSKSSINKLIFSEHILLLMIGTASGFITALIAVFPALITPGTAVPYITILITLLVILLSGGLWIFLATSFAVRGDLLPALRNE